MTETPTRKRNAPKTAQREKMVEGRRQTAAVRAYLEALQAANAPKKRGRKRTPESIRAQLDQIAQQLEDRELDPVKQVQLVQQRLDLQTELSEQQEPVPAPEDFEEDFISVAKDYSERQGISLDAWKAMGVPRSVLRRAGV